MSSKKQILDSIRQGNAGSNNVDKNLPDIEIEHVIYDNKNKQFETMLNSVGGVARWLDTNITLEEYIKSNYTQIGEIATNIDLNIGHIHTNNVKDPHDLKDIDLAVIQGEFAVAENGAVWVKEDQNINRAVYFIARKLLIVVKNSEIVDSMHEAYQKIQFKDNSTFGTFISGPSKTADIEQSLVIGAHGAMECTVLFI
ncbi:MAG: LUD domain-containing protein [Sulfurospirillaceae bacterium]|nr:LUD domain-containing protein [Sulfurospirillaceae bacterium]